WCSSGALVELIKECKLTIRKTPSNNTTGPKQSTNIQSINIRGNQSTHLCHHSTGMHQKSQYCPAHIFHY
ncbi:15580_t:CDS:2, partial [Racocetra persica]